MFTVQSGFGLEYAVRSPFFKAAGRRVLVVGTPATAKATGADFVSFAAAVDASKAGDIIELLPGQHEADGEDEEDEQNGGGVYINKAITIHGRRGDNGERPSLVGARRVLVAVNSCFIRDVTFRSTQTSAGLPGSFPTVLVCNTFHPLSNRDMFVEFEDCDLRVPNPYNPNSEGLLARVQDGAPAGRTVVKLTRCVSRRVCHTEAVQLLKDASSDIGRVLVVEGE